MKLNKEKQERSFCYQILVGNLSKTNIDYKKGIMHLRDTDAIKVPWGTDNKFRIQQEIAIPSHREEKISSWDDDYEFTAVFSGETESDLIPEKVNNIITYFDVALARNDPFTAMNGEAIYSGIIFTDVYHNPVTDRDEVHVIREIKWNEIKFSKDSIMLGIKLILKKNGDVEAFYSTDIKKNEWIFVCKSKLPDSNFQGRIITGAYSE